MSKTHLGEFSGNERFEVRRRVGSGGMGFVYEVFDRELGKSVALKTIKNRDASSLYRFKNEFRTMSNIAHPNLVRLNELFSNDDECFFTMELVDGEDWLRHVCPDGDVPDLEVSSASSPSTLREDLGETVGVEVVAAERGNLVTVADQPDPTERTRVHSGTGLDSSTDDHIQATDSLRPKEDTIVMSPARPSDPSLRVCPAHETRLRRTLRQLAEAIDHLHANNKLHRDLKPSNVMVARRGRVVVLDFGLSTEVVRQADSGTTEGGGIVGTAGYMAPEQAAGRSLTKASDWYSVGVMLYRALTGQLPYSGSQLEVLINKQHEDAVPPNVLADGVPQDLNDLCVDLMARNPAERPTGAEVLKRLGSKVVGLANANDSQNPAHRLFVGRETQLVALAEAFAMSRKGNTLKAFVHGRSGAGKSALSQRFLEDLLQEGEVVVLAGRCYEQESVAYKALDTLIDSLSRYLRRLKRPEVEALLPRDVHALARVFPVLRRVDAVAEAPLRGVEIPDQQELRRRAFGALRELLARIGDRRPLVLYIDDLQWGDLDSAALLADLLRPPDPPVLLLMCSYRSEYATVSPCLKRLLETDPRQPVDVNRRDISVDAFTPAESRALVNSLISDSDVSMGFLTELVIKEAGGIPFFVIELVQHLRQLGAKSQDGFSSLESLTLDEVLWNRISKLPRAAKILLETLAVAGRPIRQSLACSSVELGPEGFEALSLLRKEHLVRSTGATLLDDVEVYHDRIRETVIRHMPDASLRERNLGLGRELEDAGGADPETLALHFEGGGESQKAGKFYALAAAQGAESLAFERAAKLYELALKLNPGTPSESRALKIRLADALANAGKGLESAGSYLAAAQGAELDEVRRLHQLAGYQYLATGHIDEGLNILRDVLQTMGLKLPSTPKDALTTLLRNRFILKLRGLKYRERKWQEIPPQELARVDIARSIAVGLTVVDWIRGSSFTSRSLLLALAAGEPQRVCLSLAWEAVPSACEGRRAKKRTERLINAADTLAQRLDDPHAIGMTTMARGASEFLLGRFLSAVDVSDRAVEILRDRCTGVIWEMDTAQLFALWALTYSGHLGELQKRCPRIAKEARDRGDRYLESTVTVYPAVLARLAADEPDEGRRQMEEAIGRWSQSGFHVQHLTCFYGAMDLELYDDNAEAAWKRVTETWPKFEESQLPNIQLVKIYFLQQSARAALALAAKSPSDRQMLWKAAEGYAKRLDRERLDWSRALAVMVRAALAHQRGQRDLSVNLLHDLITRCDHVALDLFAASARRQLGRLIGGGEGRSLIKQSETWMKEQSIRRPDKMANAMIPGFESR